MKDAETQMQTEHNNMHQYNTTDPTGRPSMFDNKPKSATNTTYHSKSGANIKTQLAHQSMNVTHGHLKSMGGMRDTHSGSLAVTAADNMMTQSSQQLLASETVQIKEFAKRKYYHFKLTFQSFRTKNAEQRQKTL